MTEHARDRAARRAARWILVATVVVFVLTALVATNVVTMVGRAASELSWDHRPSWRGAAPDPATDPATEPIRTGTGGVRRGS